MFSWKWIVNFEKKKQLWPNNPIKIRETKDLRWSHIQKSFTAKSKIIYKVEEKDVFHSRQLVVHFHKIHKTQWMVK